MQAEDCTREGIVKALSAVPTISTVVSVISELKLAPLLPNQRGQGTLFLPKDTAFEALGKDFTFTRDFCLYEFLRASLTARAQRYSSCKPLSTVVHDDDVKSSDHLRLLLCRCPSRRASNYLEEPDRVNSSLPFPSCRGASPSLNRLNC